MHGNITLHSVNPNAMNKLIKSLDNFFFERLSMIKFCVIWLRNREHSKVFKAKLVFFLCAVQCCIEYF